MISKITARILAVALLGAAVAACSADSGPKEVGGTLVGAGAGALIGNAIGGAAGNRAAGTIAGAAIGGLIGNRIGAAMDDEDKRRAYAAQVQALESGPSGAPVAWRNPDSGRYGSVVPGPAYRAAGHELPAVHPHHLHRRQAADRARRRLPQPGRHLEAGVTDRSTRAATGRSGRREPPVFVIEVRERAAVMTCGSGSGRNAGTVRGALSAFRSRRRLASTRVAFLALAWPWLSGAVAIPYDAKSQFYPQLAFLARSLAAGPVAVLDAERLRRLAADCRSAIADLLPPPFRRRAARSEPELRGSPTRWCSRCCSPAVSASSCCSATAAGMSAARWWRRWRFRSAARPPRASSTSARSRAWCSCRWRCGCWRARWSARPGAPGAGAGVFAALIVLGRDQVSLLAVYVLAGFVLWHWFGGADRRARIAASVKPLAAGAVVGALIVDGAGDADGAACRALQPARRSAMTSPAAARCIRPIC